MVFVHSARDTISQELPKVRHQSGGTSSSAVPTEPPLAAKSYLSIIEGFLRICSANLTVYQKGGQILVYPPDHPTSAPNLTNLPVSPFVTQRTEIADLRARYRRAKNGGETCVAIQEAESVL